VNQEVPQRIEKLLKVPEVEVKLKTKTFLLSLLKYHQNKGKLTEKQYSALNSLEERYDEKERAKWLEEYDDEKRRTAQICAEYYLSQGVYFVELAKKILDEPLFIPSKKQYKVMCCNKYAKKVVESTLAPAKYPVGSFVEPRASASWAFKNALDGKPAMVVEVNAGVITTHAKGGKPYYVLVMGSNKMLTVQERHIKQSRRSK